ncbi:MAG: XdhC family protein [Bacillota bacterium]|nr:XdhC family protein [Bacillota bacterium]
MIRKEIENIRTMLEAGQTASLSRDIGNRTYIRKFIPRERLIILGAGHIAQPLCRIGAMLDFDVTVADDRSSFANIDRFPDAANVVCDNFMNAIKGIKIRDTDYVCVVTRGHRWDGDCLREIFKGTQPAYLGMIGSRRRVAGLFSLLEEEGYKHELVSSVHAPIGIDIKAVTPAEIAISICAQLVEQRRKNEIKEPAEVLAQKNVDLDMVEFLVEGEGAKAVMMVLESGGSTPVKPGAMMAVDFMGNTYGTIGGGCSESAVMSKARKLMGTGKSEVVEVDMSNDVAEDEGMVCGGYMSVLIEDVSEEGGDK